MINLASLIVASAPVAEAAMSGETTALLSAAGISALLSLALLEIVLGIDNVVFIAILAERVEESKQKMARYVGLALAMIMRIGLLFAASAIVKLDKTVLFTMPFASLFAEGGAEVTARDLVLILGGGFLIAKATMELHHMALGDHSEARAKRSKAATLGTVLTQIVLMDLIFSVDSVITAVGMTDNLLITPIASMTAMTMM
ncbi:MAG: TerC family protein, partial [Planctomycetota bacterium]